MLEVAPAPVWLWTCLSSKLIHLSRLIILPIVSMAFSPSPDLSPLAALPAIASALRQIDASVWDTAAAQLQDLVTNAPARAAAAVCVAVAKNADAVHSAFVQALVRPGLSEAAQHSLVLAMMAILDHDDAKELSTAMVRACDVFLPALLRIIAQEHPVSSCR